MVQKRNFRREGANQGAEKIGKTEEKNMNYFTERSLYYYFMMAEITEVGARDFKAIAQKFGVNTREAGRYTAALSHETLLQLTTPDDVAMYVNYLEGYCDDETEFGKSERERAVLGLKELALRKICSMFDDAGVKGNRLRTLSHCYHRDHIASVLYALQVLLLNADESSVHFAIDILEGELNEGKNSDAGLVLLQLREEKSETLERIAKAPDMLLRPTVMGQLRKRYHWNGRRVMDRKRAIGF